MKTLLFVCSGNTCRSPLALAAWRALPTSARRDVRAISAGLWARDGAPAAMHSRDIAREWGADLSDHHAQTLTAPMALEADWICVMTPEHADFVRARFGRRDALELGAFVALPPKISAQPGLAPDLAAQPGDAISLEESERLRQLLGEASEQNHSILDPFGGSREAYASCALQIRRAVENLARILNP